MSGISGTPVRPVETRMPWRADRTWRTLSLIPFGEALLLAVFARSYLPPLFAKPPDMLGIPVGFVLEVLILAWAALGARVIWTTKSQAMATLALVTTTGPAVPLLLLAPALILIMQNLAV
jgi:hypothetical protein